VCFENQTSFGGVKHNLTSGGSINFIQNQSLDSLWR